MKRIILVATLAIAAASLNAQTVYDGLTFSRNDYYGTARSIGMGNAMTAVGGDLGSIGINPAGSAVAGYSQFTLTPNITVSSASSSYSAYPVGGVDNFINSQNSSLTRFSMPNFGSTINFKTGKNTGLKNFTIGFVVNGTNNFTDKMIAGGLNDKTSYMAAMAVGAEGYDVDFLNGYRSASGSDIDVWDNAYYNPDDRGYYAPWNTIVNAQAGSIGTFGYPDEPDYYYRYVGASELFTDTGDVDEYGNHIYNIALGGPLQQTYGRKTIGSKYDFLLNIGLNFSDNFYIGANLGLMGMNYNYSEYFKEAAQNPEDFPNVFGDKTVYFNNYRSRYSYVADASGVFGKIGFIAKPAGGLRIGAAIQTPTVINVNETWKHAVDITYNGSGTSSATSPEGEYRYDFIAPYRVNAGIAYTFLGFGMVSLDYEMVDYSAMRFRDYDDTFNDNAFSSLNSEIKERMGRSDMLRVGAEFKPIPELAVRAGYNYTMTPEYEGLTTLRDKINSYSVGLGYSSEGSFFADIAARMTEFADEYISPYADYMDVASPMILNKRNRWDITLTFGWRF